jgi:hypothetical protein
MPLLQRNLANKWEIYFCGKTTSTLTTKTLMGVANNTNQTLVYINWNTSNAGAAVVNKLQVAIRDIDGNSANYGLTTANTFLTDGNWHQYWIGRNSDVEIFCYIDNVKQDMMTTATLSNCDNFGNAGFEFPFWFGTLDYKGASDSPIDAFYLDNCMIFGRNLTIDERTAMYNTGRSISSLSGNTTAYFNAIGSHVTNYISSCTANVNDLSVEGTIEAKTNLYAGAKSYFNDDITCGNNILMSSATANIFMPNYAQIYTEDMTPGVRYAFATTRGNAPSAFKLFPNGTSARQFYRNNIGSWVELFGYLSGSIYQRAFLASWRNDIVGFYSQASNTTPQNVGFGTITGAGTVTDDIFINGANNRVGIWNTLPNTMFNVGYGSFTVCTNGFVGIGVSSPTALFQVSTATISTPSFVVSSTGIAVGIGTITPTSYLSVNGSCDFKVNSTTYSITLNSTYSSIIATNTITITLPTASDVSGREYFIVYTGTSTCTVNTTSSQLINDQLTQTLYPYDAIHIKSDGTGWWVE